MVFVIHFLNCQFLNWYGQKCHFANFKADHFCFIMWNYIAAFNIVLNTISHNIGVIYKSQKWYKYDLPPKKRPQPGRILHLRNDYYFQNQPYLFHSHVTFKNSIHYTNCTKNPLNTSKPSSTNHLSNTSQSN